jgi:uncharacterized protein
MKLHLTTSNTQNLITGYEAGKVMVNHRAFTQNLIVLPEQLIENWKPLAESNIGILKALSMVDFIEIATLKPEVVLLGTGETHQFIHPKLYALLTEQQIALECMTTAAACRTYNILMGEGRNVAAMLII